MANQQKSRPGVYTVASLYKTNTEDRLNGVIFKSTQQPRHKEYLDALGKVEDGGRFVVKLVNSDKNEDLAGFIEFHTADALESAREWAKQKDKDSNESL